MADHETEVSNIQGEEEHEKCKCRTNCADKQESGEDEPPSQIETDRMVKVILVRVRAADRKATGCQDNSERDPESTVGRERGSTEGVADSHLPVTIVLTEWTTGAGKV